jgi:hypothetical protein
MINNKKKLWNYGISVCAGIIMLHHIRIVITELRHCNNLVEKNLQRNPIS